MTLVLHSGDVDKVMAALTIAIGAASMGTETHLMFSFWSTPVLRHGRPPRLKRSPTERLFGWLLPCGPARLKASRFNMCGLGSWLIRRRMKARGMLSIEENLAIAAELGVHLYVCEASLGVLGLTLDDLIDYPGLKSCGVATFVERAMSTGQTLFV